MIKIVSASILIFVTLTAFSQGYDIDGVSKHSENKIKVHSFGLGLGIFGTNLGSDPSASGLSMYSDFIIDYKNHLFSLYGEGGSEVVFSSADYGALNLTYGRTLFKSKPLRIEGHSGLGYLYFHASGKKTKTLGIPLRVKLELNLGKHVGLGLNPNVIWNAKSVIYSASLGLIIK